jgi:hypothetical protein
MLYLGVDPGKVTGYSMVAKRDERIFTIDFRNIEWKDFFKWLDAWPKYYEKYATPGEKVIVVCEDYIQRYSPKGSGEYIHQTTAKQVGAVCLRANQLGWRYVEQQPAIKPVGYKLAKLQNTHLHWQDACVHATYAAHNGIPKKHTIWWD